MDGSPGFGDELDGAVVGAPFLLGDLAADIAAFLVVKFHARVLSEKLAEFLWSCGTIAPGGNRGADELHGGILRLEGIEIGGEFIGPIRMDVAGENDGIADVVIPQLAQHGATLVFVTGPLIHAVGDFRSGGAVDPGHHDLLGEDVPGGVRLVHGLEQPVPLGGAHEGATTAQGFRARRLVSITARLVGAVLSGVENKEVGELTEGQLAIDAHFGAGWEGTST